jgi:hypothetical protein
LNINSEKYADDAKVTHNALGFSARYMFDRTYGFNVAVEKDLEHEFTDETGVKHDVPRSVGVSTAFTYRPAMNFAVNLNLSNSRATRIVPEGTNGFNNGYSWNLGLDYLF